MPAFVKLCATFFARTLGVISTRRLTGELSAFFGNDGGALTAARTRRQPSLTKRDGFRVVATATSGSSLFWAGV